MDSTTLIDYLRVTDRFRKEEVGRVEELITWEVGQEILKAFRREMLVKPLQQLMKKEHGFTEFLKHRMYEEIKLMY
jgi:hypothetical protein